MTETVSDLLPCPFCGSTDLGDQGPSYTQIMCNACGASEYDQPNRAEAVAAWNRRTPPQNTDGEAVAGLIGRLRASADRLDEHFQFDGDVNLIEADEMREAAAALSAMKVERDALLADSTDKAQAWDAIAKKNATIAALKSDLTRYIDIANAEANEAESLRAQVALHRKDSSDYLDALVRERARAEKAEAERDALAKALEDIDAKAVLGMCHGLTADDDCCQIHAIASRALQGDAK